MESIWPRELDCVSTQSNVFVPYKSQKFTLGSPHPQFLVEPVGLSLVSPPDIWYELRMDKKYWMPDERGICHVSQPQLETIVYAMQSFAETVTYELGPKYESEIRTFTRGYFIGSGTGTGKTRELAGVVSECFSIELKADDERKSGQSMDGTKVGGGEKKLDEINKVLWVTTSAKMFDGAREEIRAFFPSAKFIEGVKGEEKMTGGRVNGKVVLLTTYSMLAQLGRQGDIKNWLGDDFQGLMVFDEIHLAKSAYSSKRVSVTGDFVIDLQEQYNKAKVIYSSATGASEVSHLRIMKRLGIWGKGKEFETDAQFAKEIPKMGVSAIEVLALRLKQDGVFCSRVVDFQGCKMQILNAEIDKDFQRRYEMSCQMWQLMIKYFEHGRQLYIEDWLEKKKGIGRVQGAPSSATFYSDCLLYFNSLIASSKLHSAAKFAREQLRNNRSIIFGLKHTGETQYELFKKGTWNKGLPYSNVQMILRRVLLSLGVPVGCPKYYSLGGFSKIGNWEDWQDDVEKRVDQEHWSRKINWTWCQPATHGPSEVASPEKQMDNFPDYTVGYYLRQPNGPIKDAEKSDWDYEWVRRGITSDGLARLYHQLSIWLPINAMDELVDRMATPLQYTDENGVLVQDSYTVADLTGRTKKYQKKAGNQLAWEAVSWDGTPEDSDDDSADGEPTAKRMKIAEEDECGSSSRSNSCRSVSRKIVANKDKNKEELSAFMGKEKRVAIISGASSTGVSLHSDKGCQNRQRRVHITIELSYGPEQIVQQLGRSNRSNQKHHPEFVLLKTPIPAEIRMTSVAGKRVRQLGAICYGHINGALLSDQLDDDFSTSSAGMAAVKAGLEAIKPDVPEFVENMEKLKGQKKVNKKKKGKKGKKGRKSEEADNGEGVDEGDEGDEEEGSDSDDMFGGKKKKKVVSIGGRLYFTKSNEENMSRLLNRTMYLPIALQNKFYSAAQKVLDAADTCVHSPLKVLDLKRYDFKILRTAVSEAYESCIRYIQVERWCSKETMTKGGYQLYMSVKKDEFTNQHDYVAAKQSPGDPNRLVAVFPFCKNEVLVQKDFLEYEGKWRKVVGEDEKWRAELQWTLQCMWKTPLEWAGLALCHHKTKGLGCPEHYKKEKRGCIERWGKAEFVMLTNPTLRMLKAVNTCKFKRTQLASIQVVVEDGRTEQRNVLIIGNEEDCKPCHQIYEIVCEALEVPGEVQES